ncbi:MAG TPA: hypothetical protein VMU12_02290, partial [Candidatus Paceibacterota bacterium]|nr:hypothetical protein [Candidatus Paceibacterota bacterium]
VDTSTIGTYTISYDATGFLGIHAPTVTRTVNVVAGGGGHRSGTLDVHSVVYGGTMKPGDFKFIFEGGTQNFDASGTNEYERSVGNYTITPMPVDGYVVAESGDCDPTGLITVEPGVVKTCVITNTVNGWQGGEATQPEQPAGTAPQGSTGTGEQPAGAGGSGSGTGTGTLIVQQTIVGASASYGQFSVTVGSQSQPFGQTGSISLDEVPGRYLVTSHPAVGFSSVLAGDCLPTGDVTITSGETATCSITSTLIPVETPTPSATPPPVVYTPTPTPVVSESPSVSPSPSETPSDLTGNISQGFLSQFWSWLSGLFH